MPAFRYKDAPAAIDWLCRVIGFAQHLVIPNPDSTIAHCELTLNGGMVMLGSWRDDEFSRRFRSPHDIGGAETASVYVAVDDTDAIYARAKDAGAEIIAAPYDTDYGSHECSFKDLEGHTWTVGTYDPWKPQA
jgi:uncharacterized glyoxalase superfamily protein PhnB